MRFSTFLLKNLLRRKVRTTLTCIGIAVAVGTTISLLGISDSFERGMVQSFSGRGVDIVVLEANVLDQLTSDISLAARDQVEQVPGVKAAAPGLLDIIAYRMGNTDKSLVLQGWDPDSFLFDSLEFIEGGPIGKDEEGTVMLGDELSKQIQKKLGDTLEIDGHAMKVVGVFHSPIWQENSCFIIPLKAMQKMTLREGRITGMSVILQNAGASHDEVQKICDQIDQLTDDNGNSYRLSAKQTNDYVSNSLHIKATHAMAWLTSMIAITVGAIGMLNTMIMAVVERVKEISILRAIGWRKG
ncbi:MAG: ABC transporter permease, partial [Planctomycetales bacterium]|nr:ABC transporter permease [Planctomycetales bacterium]